MRAIALVPLLIALTPRGPHGPIGDTWKRTHTYPAARHRTLGRNLVQAFGGGTTIFAHLKVRDNRNGLTSAPGAVTRIDSDQAFAEAALSSLGAARNNVRFANSSLPIDQSIRSCTNLTFHPSSASLRMATYLSVVGQLESRKSCFELITAAEQRTGLRYDHAFVQRADLVFPVAVPHWRPDARRLVGHHEPAAIDLVHHWLGDHAAELYAVVGDRLVAVRAHEEVRVDRVEVQTRARRHLGKA